MYPKIPKLILFSFLIGLAPCTCPQTTTTTTIPNEFTYIICSVHKLGALSTYRMNCILPTYINYYNEIYPTNHETVLYIFLKN